MKSTVVVILEGQKKLGDKKRRSFSNLPQSQSGSMTNITSNLKNILADLNNIKDPRVREEVKEQIVNELKKMQNSVSDIGLDSSSQLILKMKIDNIRKEIERVTLEREDILRELGVSIDDKDEIERMITRELRIKVNKLAKEKIDEAMREALTYG